MQRCKRAFPYVCYDKNIKRWFFFWSIIKSGLISKLQLTEFSIKLRFSNRELFFTAVRSKPACSKIANFISSRQCVHREDCGVLRDMSDFLIRPDIWVVERKNFLKQYYIVPQYLCKMQAMFANRVHDLASLLCVKVVI